MPQHAILYARGLRRLNRRRAWRRRQNVKRTKCSPLATNEITAVLRTELLLSRPSGCAYAPFSLLAVCGIH